MDVSDKFFFMKNHTDHEYNSKKHKVLNEFGYGVMWLFLAILLELLFYFNEIQMFLYHLVVAVLALAALYKFYKGIKKYQRLEKDNV